MTGTIYLIVEDRSDGKVVEALLQARGLPTRVEARPSSIGGIFQLEAELEQLIQSAIRDKKSNDCIAVLHDTDLHRQPDRTVYESIKSICRAYQDHVLLVIARDEIESWLLSDSGLCGWLGIKPRPFDEQPKPKDTLNSLLKQDKGIKYQGSYRAQVWKHLAGDGDRYSPSLRLALEHLDDAPCTHPETENA